MQLTSRSGYLASHEWQKSGRFYSDLRNKSSGETWLLSASTTVVKATRKHGYVHMKLQRPTTNIP